MSRLTDNDRRYGPVTIGPTRWRPWRLVYSSGGDGDCDRPRNTLTGYAFGWVCQLRMPNILQPYRVKHMAKTWDAATVARLGRDWYFETFPREYGFSLSDGFLQLFLGRQTHDSISTQDWCAHLPWTQWRHIRISLYNPDGSHFWTQLERDAERGIAHYEKQRKAEELCPSVAFEFEDFDGARIIATCRIEEREWRLGEGWFKWLSWFRAPRISRYLDLKFSAEVGPEKGSWKGGTIGSSTEMLTGESCEFAFRRYCQEDHRSKYRTFRLKFIGAAA